MLALTGLFPKSYSKKYRQISNDTYPVSAMNARISPPPSVLSIKPRSPEDRPARAQWHAKIECLFEQKNTALLHFLAAHLHSAQDAREVAQEAYEWLLRHQDDPRVLDWRDPLELLLFGVARGIARNRMSRRKNHDRIQRRVLSADYALHGQVPAPEQLCAVREVVAIIKQSLDELPPRCRQVFILARIEGMGVEDIAKKMSVAPRSVWGYIARAMAHCQRRLDEAERPTGKMGKKHRLKTGDSHVEARRRTT